MAVLSNVLKDGELIPQKEWDEQVQSLREKAIGEGSKEKLREAIVEAVKKRIPDKKFGIFLSGGVDSSFITLLCKQLGSDFTCYSVGFQDGEMNVPPERAA